MVLPDVRVGIGNTCVVILSAGEHGTGAPRSRIRGYSAGCASTA
jgi:hypothetical protein